MRQILNRWHYQMALTMTANLNHSYGVIGLPKYRNGELCNSDCNSGSAPGKEAPAAMLLLFSCDAVLSATHCPRASVSIGLLGCTRTFLSSSIVPIALARAGVSMPLVDWDAIDRVSGMMACAPKSWVISASQQIASFSLTCFRYSRPSCGPSTICRELPVNGRALAEKPSLHVV